MKKVYDDGTVPRREGEVGEDYYARIRNRVVATARHERRLKRRNASAARKKNR